MLTDSAVDGGSDYPEHVAAVLGSDAPPETVRDFYVWCDEFGVGTATVCLPDTVDRSPYTEAVADLEPSVRVVEEVGDADEGSRFLSYLGGRDELVGAFRLIAEDASEGRLGSDEVDAEAVEERLAVPGEPDLLIESGNALSDVLVWQTVYSELCHVDTLDRSSFVGCLEDYTERERRYGR